MALRAVIFDYGMVLSEAPDAAAFAAMTRITGLTAEQLDALYWSRRNAYDAGELTGEAFWQAVARDAGLALDAAAIDDLVELDTRMWLTVNPAMLDWQLALKRRGFLTAIVSNMGDTVHAAMERELSWLAGLDVTVWSYQLGITKPDPAIYHFVLEKLGVRAEEALFLDDRAVNVSAAVAAGMAALVFTTVAKLRADLEGMGLDGELPLPG